MQIRTKDARITKTGGEYHLTAAVDPEQLPALQDFLAESRGKLLEIQINKKTTRRSLSANGYLWTLCQGIAQQTHQTKEEVYKELIRRRGYCEAIRIQRRAAPTFIATWTRNGLGYQAEEIRSDGEDAREFLLYFGSSSYSTAQMAELIEEAEESARENGVSLEDPETVKEMIEKWQ